MGASPAFAADNSKLFLGHWALTIPGGGAGWIGVSESQGKLAASLMWGGGSVVAVSNVKVDGDTLVLTRESGSARRNASGSPTTTESAEKPVGEWQPMDITLVDRHATVVLNGKKIIDNQPILGCTGGALWSDPLRPGPIYLQGDHSGASYRNIILRPAVK